MNRSGLEDRLRDEAKDIQVRCPDTPRQQVLRVLRDEQVEPARAPATRFGWMAVAAAAVLVVLVTAVLRYEPAEPVNTPLVRTGTPVRLPTISGDLIDRAVADREASLEAEMARIQADLQKLKTLVKNV